MKKKIFIATSIFLILLGVGFGYRAFFGGNQDSFSAVEARMQSIVEKVTATGSLLPQTRIRLEPEIQKKVKNVFVEVGDRVKKDEILIQLEDSEVYTQIRKAQSSANTALSQVDLLKTQLENAEWNLEKAQTSAQESINNAQAKVQSASTSLATSEQNLEDVKRQQESALDQAYESARNTADSNLVTAEEAILDLEEIEADHFSGGKQIEIKVQGKVERSEAEFQDAKELIKNSLDSEDQAETHQALLEFQDSLETLRDTLAYVRNEAMEDPRYEYEITSTEKSTVSTHKAEVESAITSVVSARQNIDSQEITYDKTINTAQSELNSARSSLSSARANLSYVKSQAKEKIVKAETNLSTVKKELDVKRSQLETAYSDLEKAYEDLEDTAIKAPVDGTVTKVDIEKGETAKPGVEVISLIPQESFKIEADISEVDIGNVEEQDKAVVDFDAYPGEEYVGEIAKIHPAEIVKEGVIYYRIEIMLDKYPEKLRPGLTANLEIISAEKEQALTVPYVAVKSKNGENFVEVVKEDGSVEEREVQIGLEGDTRVEISDGLQPDEAVVTYRE